MLSPDSLGANGPSSGIVARGVVAASVVLVERAVELGRIAQRTPMKSAQCRELLGLT